MRIRAAFDCDGVILRADEIFRDHFECQGYSVIETGKFDYALDPEASPSAIGAMIDDCIDRRTIDMDPYEGVEDMFSKLYDQTFEPITVVTSRSPSFASATTLALNRVFKNIPFVTGYTDGATKLFHLRNFPVIVEDRRRTAIQLAMVGKIVLVPKRSYNWPMTVPAFEVNRKWTWLEEADLPHYGVGYKSQPPDLFWCGRVVYMDSMESFLKNEKLFNLLLT